MSSIDRFSVVTLVFFLLSTIFVINPVSFHVRVPRIGRQKVTLGLMTAPIIAIFILWASQCIGPTQIRDGIIGTDNVKPYNILILFISLAYMAITLDVTGILQSAAFWVSNKGGSNGRKLFFYFYLLLTGISMVVGNDPVILSGTVFLVYYTTAADLDPLAWLISEFAAANTASMVLFVGNPTNVVICEGFHVNNAAFTAYTILPFLACSVACYAGLALQFRDSKYVPKKLKTSEKLNPLDVLRDPVSAVFGSILLIVCLIVVVALSFLHIDVWMIVLPFAIAKFVFDLGWDHYRFVTHRIDPSSADDDVMLKKIQRAMSIPQSNEAELARLDAKVASVAQPTGVVPDVERTSSPEPTQTSQPNGLPNGQVHFKSHFYPEKLMKILKPLSLRFPTISTAFPRLPFGLIPFAFSQFILIEGLAHRGWIDLFGQWLVKASERQMVPTIWLIGIMGVLLCNGAGTNIGATILLTKIVRAAQMPDNAAQAAAIALAVASNIGAVSFTFSASLAGLLWDSILRQKKVTVITQARFALWNCLPLLLMTTVGLGVVTAEMLVLYR